MKKIIGLILLVLITACSEKSNDVNENTTYTPKHEPVMDTVKFTDYANVVYVSLNKIEGERDGSKEKPFDNLSAALEKSNSSEESQTAVLVSEGSYSVSNLELQEFVHLFGGYDGETWERDIAKYKAVLLGTAGSRMIIGADNAVVNGFTITGAEYRGKGAAVYCDGTSPTFSNNVFAGNKTLKPSSWNPKYWHETANDGGALYGTNGASPVIKNNIFINNKTENGRGAAIAFDGKCDPQIVNNTFYKNTSGLDDPMRSSDGAAISIFRWSKGLIEGNVFLSNFAKANNDGGAVFIALWSSTVVKDNIFVDNESGDDAGALFVGGQEHRYDAPLDKYPPKDEFFVTIENNTFVANRNPSMNSGAMRFTMESRGKFVNNVVAQNNGVYFQRSETEIRDNVILDNMLVIETKEGLDKSTIEGNVIWADFVLNETEADVKNNKMLYADEYEGNEKKLPAFSDDGFEAIVYSGYYNKSAGYSELVIQASSELEEGDMIDRIVNKGSEWGVVKSYENNMLQVWGNFSAASSITVLPTYTLRNDN